MATQTSYRRPCFDTASAPSSDASIRSAVELIDFNAQHNPDHLFCIQFGRLTETSRSLEPVRNGQRPPVYITHRHFRNMIHRCQTWINATIHEVRLEGVTKGPVVGMLVDSDVGLLVHMFSFMGLGIPVLLLSTTLGPEAIRFLLSKCEARAMVASRSLRSLAKEALALLAPDDRPELYEMVTYTQFAGHVQGNPKVATAGHYVSDTDRNVLIVHTSGNSGTPKAVPQSHRYLLSYGSHNSVKFDDTWPRQRIQGVAFSTVPFYHCYGLHAPLLSLSIGKPFSIPPSEWHPSGEATIDFLRKSKSRALFTVPSILKDIARMPENTGIRSLCRLDCVTSGGAHLSDHLGQALVAAGVKLTCAFSTTEAGNLSVLRILPSNSDWQFFRLREDQVYTLEPLSSGHYHIKVQPPGWTEYITLEDRFKTGPENPGLDFKPVGREDELFKLQNGNFVQPWFLEVLFSSFPAVRGSLAFGQGRPHVGVLVEVYDPRDDVDSLKKTLWGSSVLVGHGISSVDAIIILPPDLKFPRSAKGTILRQESYKLFQEEIYNAYLRHRKSEVDVENILNNMSIDWTQEMSKYLGLERGAGSEY